MSEDEGVLSVMQGTVLASILFVITMSDINMEENESIVGCFADDMKIIKTTG